LVAKPGVRYLCNRGRQCFFSQVENLDGNTALNRGNQQHPMKADTFVLKWWRSTMLLPFFKKRMFDHALVLEK
jgi:hypothetical protein